MSQAQRNFTRGEIAEMVAVKALGLAPNDCLLKHKQWEKFRQVYSQAYMAQHGDPVMIEPSCTCSHRPWPHVHSGAERETARRRFDWHLQQGRGDGRQNV